MAYCGSIHLCTDEGEPVSSTIMVIHKGEDKYKIESAQNIKSNILNFVSQRNYIIESFDAAGFAEEDTISLDEQYADNTKKDLSISKRNFLLNSLVINGALLLLEVRV